MCSTLRCDQAATDEEVLQERRKLGVELTSQEVALLTSAEQKKLLVSSLILYHCIAHRNLTFFLVDVRP
jgi:hypothetical protein